MEVDREWFKRRLKSLGMSQADLARAVRLHGSALSNALNGKRRIKVEEARDIAQALRAELAEVLVALGIEDDIEFNGVSLVFGHIKESDEISVVEVNSEYITVKEGAPLWDYAGETIIIDGNFLSPRYLPGETIGFINPDNFFQNYSPKFILDDWKNWDQRTIDEIRDSLEFAAKQFHEEHSPSFDPTKLIGKEVVVKISDGRFFLRRLREGRNANTFLLTSLNATAAPLETEIEWASPIDWHRPL